VLDRFTWLWIRHRTAMCIGIASVPAVVVFFASWANGEQWWPALWTTALTGFLGVVGGLLLARAMQRRRARR
jgi:zinc transporter ZupT